MKFTINLPKFISYSDSPTELGKIKAKFEEEKKNAFAQKLFEQQALHRELEQQKIAIKEQTYFELKSKFEEEKKTSELQLQQKLQEQKIDIQRETFDELDTMLVAKMKEFEEKYLEEHIEQLNRMNKVDLAVLPSLMNNKTYGNKELPLQYAVREAYAINPTVASCVNVIAQSTSLIPFTLRKQGKDGQYTTIFKDAILNLLNCPNETQTQSEFIESIVMNLLLCGNALVYKNTGKDRGGKYNPKAPVSELIILNPDYIEYKDNGFEITEYRGREKSPYDSPENVWEPGEIIHFRLTNPLNPFWGLSPIQSAYKAIDLDSKILQWWMETLENGCRKDMLIKFKHELTDLQYKRVTNLIQNQVAGFRNGRSFMILGHEANVEFLNIAPAELDFKESRKMSSDEIKGIFRVPGPLLGNTDGATLNNSRELIVSFWLNTIMPLLNHITEVLSKRLLSNFNKDKNIFSISYDTTEVPAIQSIFAEKWDIISKQVQVGVPLNVAIKGWKLQMPDIEGGDVGYMSHNLVPLGFYEEPGALAGSEEPTQDTSKEKPALGPAKDDRAAEN